MQELAGAVTCAAAPPTKAVTELAVFFLAKHDRHIVTFWER